MPPKPGPWTDAESSGQVGSLVDLILLKPRN